jgi:hypothetical protein
MSAGFAAADVAVSGSARMGIISTNSNSVMSSRVQMSFSGTGTTDGGLAFGGSFDAHNSQGANAGTSGSTFISGAFGKISMGDVAGGDAASVGEIDSAVGYTGLGSRGSNSYASDGGAAGSLSVFGTLATKATVTSTFTGGAVAGVGGNSTGTVTTTITPAGAAATNVTTTDGSKVLYTYTAGGVTLNASSSQLATNGGQSAYGVGASYTTGALTMGVGFGSSDITIDNVNVVVDAGKTAGGVAITAGELASGTFSGFKGDATDTTVSAKYVMGDTTFKLNYQVKSIDVTRAADTVAVTGAALADNVLGAVVTVLGYDAATGLTLTPANDTTTQAVTALKSAVNAKATATSMGASVSHKIDAMTINAFVSTTEVDLDKLAKSSTRTASGLGVAYDLGGGATIKAGVVNFTTPSLTQTSITQGAHGSLGSGLYAADTLVAGKVTQTSSNVYDIGISFKF